MSTLNEMINKYNQSTSSNEQKEKKSILKTASAGTQYLGQGALRGLEGVFVDTPLTIAAGVRKLFGDDTGAKALMDASNVSLTNMLINKVSGNETNPYINNNQNLWNQEVDKNSFIKENNIGGKVIGAVGEMLPTIAIGGSISGGKTAQKIASNTMLGAKAFSGGANEAYQDSESIGKSMLYGLGSAATELLTEKISDGIPGLKQINGNTKKEIAKNYLKSVAGEGIEEIASSLVNPILQTSYKGTESLKQYGTSDYWKDVIESGVVGSLSGAVLDSPNTIQSLYNNEISNINKTKTENSNVLLKQDESKFEYLPTNNEKSNVLRQSASKYFNNSQDTINLINTFDKVIKDKNYNIIFDDSIVNQHGNSVNAQIQTKNGETVIKINPNSSRAGEFLLTHEITHSIENESMKNLILDYAGKNNEFNQALENLKQTYGTNDVSSEVISDISGQLFGNQEFINSLSMEQPNIFKRIYNKIIELANKITGNSKESLFIKDLKNKWETAYRNTSLEESISNLNDSTKYMMTGINGMQNGINVNDRYNDIKNRYNQALKLEKEGIYNNEDIRQQTGWFKDNQDNWEFEISDQYTKFKMQPTANTKYKLSDIFEANTLYEMYPELKNISIEFKNINGKSGIYNSKANKIIINNAMINNLDNLRGTILHEIQHYIQKIEGLSTGTTILFGNEQYVNNKGEIEAADTKNRRNLSVEQRKSIIPESAKDNPMHPNRKTLLNRKRTPVEKIVEKVYNKFGGNSNEISEETDFQNFGKTNEENNKTYTDYENGIKELDNSSFSFSDAKQYDDLIKTNHIEYFRKDNGNVKVYLMDSNNNLLNEFSLWSNTNAIKELGKNLGNKIYETATDTNQTIRIGNDINNLGTDTDYFMNHRPSEGYGNASNFEENMPGIFEHPEWYLNLDEKYNKESLNVLKKVRNNPEAELTIYRATVGNKINSGDWVTPSKSYAEYHNNSQFDGKGNILEMKVKAKDIQFAGDDINEFGYFPNNDTKYSQQNDKWQEHLENNYKATGTRTDMQSLKLPTANEETITNNKTLKGDVLPKYNDVVDLTTTETKALPKDPTKESSYDNYKEDKKNRKEIQQELQDEMGITVEDLQIGKDISSLEYQRTDPIRLNEKVFGAEIGKKINDATINKTKHNEAERIRFLNKERDEIKNLGIKSRSKESAAVQKYGEKQYLNDKGDVITYSDYELSQEFPDVATQQKIKKAAEVIRNKYDKYIDTINQTITELGYDTIPKRKDYMRHFQELNDKFTQWGLPLNRQSLNENNIPTDINGLTDQFKPGKNWFASAMQRKGLKTTYDAITGIDGYLDGASNLMYHTEDIQRYRALSKLVRDTFGQTHGLDNIDLSTEEGQQRLNDIYDNKLSKYAAWLDEQANALAGKKGAIDRGAERVLGRKLYSVLDAAKKQVGSNMTGFNVRSALTNFASAIQGASKTNKLAFIKGTISTVQNMIHNDGIIDKSDFLTSRLKNDSQLSKKMWQKASNAGQILMTGSDYFTANQIWRSKYYENLSKGMNETQAIKNADDFSSRIMGDRSKGSTAEIFNSKTLGLLTQFQLEVNNQWSSLIHDNKIDIKNGSKTGATVLFQMGQLAAMSYMFNNLMKSLTGSEVMIDPIDMLMKIFNPDDDDDKSLEERAFEVIGDLVDNIPFGNIFTGGGRIPISEAFTGSSTFIKKITDQTNSYGNEITWKDVKDDMIGSAFYWILPTGYGQAKKTIKGLSMYSGSLPTAGSYTNSGNLRFTADESTGGKIKAALFGQYSSKEAQNYIDNGYKSISKNHIQEMKDLNMTSSEYRNYRELLKNASQTTDKNGYIKYEDDNKNIFWYDKNSKVVYDNNYNQVNKSITSLNKVSSKEKVFDCINSLNISDNEKSKLINAEYGGEKTDLYGNIKYVNNDYVYNINGLQKYKNSNGTTYWVNHKNGNVYNSSGKLATNIKANTLIPVKEEKIYWYNETNNILYDSKYNKVDIKKMDSLTKAEIKIDMSEYDKYDSYEEYIYATSNPKKYAVINQITTYDKYNQYKEEINNIRENSINKKTDTINYINSLKLNIAQKAMFIKMYYSSFNKYDNNIIEYINKQNLSPKEKKELLNELDFKTYILNGKTYVKKG